MAMLTNDSYMSTYYNCSEIKNVINNRNILWKYKQTGLKDFLQKFYFD